MQTSTSGTHRTGVGVGVGVGLGVRVGVGVGFGVGVGVAFGVATGLGVAVAAGAGVGPCTRGGAGVAAGAAPPAGGGAGALASPDDGAPPASRESPPAAAVAGVAVALDAVEGAAEDPGVADARSAPSLTATSRHSGSSAPSDVHAFAFAFAPRGVRSEPVSVRRSGSVVTDGSGSTTVATDSTNSPIMPPMTAYTNARPASGIVGVGDDGRLSAFDVMTAEPYRGPRQGQ